MTSETNQTEALTASERAELEQLRSEVAGLRAASEAGKGPRPKRPGRGRRVARNITATVLIAIACLLAPLSVVAVWARGEVTDTDRYVNTVAPLASDPAIQDAVTTNLTNIVFQYIDVQGLTTQAFTALADKGSLPPALASSLQALAVPVANGVRSFTEDQIGKVVQSSAFEQAWVEANRSAHQQLVAALTGKKGGGVSIQGNTVQLNLAVFLNTVKNTLVNNGFQLASKIPTVNATFTIFESKDVSKVQRAYNLLDKLGYWLPFILLALAALGIYVAPNHRVAFIGAGIGVALAMLLAAILLQVVRRAYLDGVPQDVLPTAAAASLYDTVIRYLREAIRAGFLVGLIVAAGAFLTGPSVTASTIRRWLVAGFAAMRGGLASAGLAMEGATHWFAAQARLLRGIVVALAFLIVILQRYKTPPLIIWVTVGVLVCLAIIQFFATPPRPPKVVPGTPRAVPVEGAAPA